MVKQHTHSSFKSLNDIIDQEKDFESIRETIKNYSIVEDFGKIFPELKNIAKVKKVEKGILFLEVENSVWKSELNFQKNKVIEKINNYYKVEVIKTIKFL